MPKSSSVPSQTYAPGVYGPFTVNNIDAADSEAYLRHGGNSWGAGQGTLVLEMRLGNGPWFELARGNSSWQGPFPNKYTGGTVTEGELVVSLPYVGEPQRDLRATFTVSGASITTSLVAGTR